MDALVEGAWDMDIEEVQVKLIKEKGFDYLGGGVYHTADMASRVAWTETVRSEADRLGMPLAYWEFGATFGLYNRTTEEWNEELVAALLSSH